MEPPLNGFDVIQLYFQGGCEFVSQQRSSPSSPNNRRDSARAQHVDIPHRHQCKSRQRSIEDVENVVFLHSLLRNCLFLQSVLL